MGKILAAVTVQPYRFRVGDSRPSLLIPVDGLQADPTLATAAVTVYRRSGYPTAVQNVAGTISDVSSYIDPLTGDTYWRCLVAYPWAAADTTNIGAGSYYVQAKLTLPAAGGVVTAPPDRSAWIELHGVETAVVLPAQAAGTTRITLAAHGFIAGNWISNLSGVWAKAIGTALAGEANGVVVQVVSANVFDALVTPGLAVIAAHGQGTAGQRLYLSAVTAGASTTTEPTGPGIYQRLGAVVDSGLIAAAFEPAGEI